MNEKALQYWQTAHGDWQAVSQVVHKLEDVLIAKVDFLPERNLVITFSRRVKELQEGHGPVVGNFFRELLSSWEGPEICGSILVWLEDGMSREWMSLSEKVPVLAFGRHLDDERTLLIPDPAFLGSNAYEKERERIAEIDGAIPWAEKQPTVFWRGASSGLLERDEENWRQAPRVMLAECSRDTNDRGLLDAAISKVVRYTHHSSAREIPTLNICAEEVPWDSFFRYRYLVDVDGEFCAWKSLFLKLCSQSLVLKISSDKAQWYFDQLEAWKHYVPLQADAKSIHEAITWIQAHDAECQKIAEQSSALMRQFNYVSERNKVREILRILIPATS